ncbi:MAG: nucleotidyltransferase domain-containing protein [Lentisphaerae bacterium]|nr:nucleotidyltransferase domain-containing protein [Lentisphaerota bacterium]
MVSRKDIKVFVEQVVKQFHPRRIILFGSYAYGRPTEDSDVDLLVIVPHTGPAAVQSARIRQKIRAGFPMDLIVRDPGTIRQRLAMGDFFIKEIIQRGKSVYEARHTRMG